LWPETAGVDEEEKSGDKRDGEDGSDDKNE